MKALISPEEIVLNGARIAQVEEQEFPVGSPLFWTECPSDCVADLWYYNDQTQTCELVPVPVPTADQNKATATSLLSATDWTTIADVGNPNLSNPYLANQGEFITYRNTVRQYAIYPVEGTIDWPTAPTENWQKAQGAK